MEKRSHKRQNEIYSQSQRRADALRKLRDERLKQKTANRHQILEQQPQSYLESADNLAEVLSCSLDLSESKQENQLEQEPGLTQPQWMIEYPDDLTRNWFVMSRPEGRRCMITALKGRTISYLKNGGNLHTFKSRLPGGSPQRMDGPSILDCIFHEPNNTYYIVDLMCWKGVYLLNCEAEFRLEWIKQKLMECEELPTNEDFGIEVLEYWNCDERGLLSALYDFVPFTRDGVCIIHKEGHYSKGPTELALIWKDLTCSRYLIETDMTGKETEDQYIILRFGDDGGLYTGDHPATRLSDLDQCVMESGFRREALRFNKLIRFKIHFHHDQESIMEEDIFVLEFAGLIRNRKRSADLMSKIIFQRYARQGKIRSDDLMRFVRQTQSNDI
eukprot:g1565.t1